MRVITLFFLLMISLSAWSSYESVDSITDEEIENYKKAISNGCYERGDAGGFDPEFTKRICSCIDETLDEAFTRQEWAQMIYDVVTSKSRDEAVSKSIPKVLETIKSCPDKIKESMEANGELE
ncbi:MAG: hypothetical protein OQJ95_11735 [Kangiella sp.]|jgi:hypothetical protein|nr:hypothetical protein [Kangiella sp.]